MAESNCMSAACGGATGIFTSVVKSGRGWARPWAGRKKRSEIVGPPPELVGPLPQKGKSGRKKIHFECQHEKPLFSNGKPRQSCFECVPKDESKRSGEPRKQYRYRSTESASCLRCGEQYLKGKSQQQYCTIECGRKYREQQAAKFARANTPPVIRKCLFCLEAFSTAYGDLRVRYCSQVCAKRYIWKKNQGDAARRRTKRYGGTYTRFSKWDVFRRDNWTCQICGTETPERLSGLRLPNSPELDHIIPLSVGGDHIESNVQCACAQCNRRKGARVPTRFLSKAEDHGQRRI